MSRRRCTNSFKILYPIFSSMLKTIRSKAFHSVSFVRAKVENKPSGKRHGRRTTLENVRKKWLMSFEADEFRNDQPHREGPIFLGNSSTQPFPLNPLYVAIKPISNSTKDEIFKLWKEDPMTWTTKKLGLHFGISILRIDAILKMKSLEDNWRERKYPLQVALATNMDRLMGSQNRICHPQEDPEPFEKIWPHFSDRLRPFFEMLSENESLTPEDAAKILRMNPFQEKVEKIDMLSEQVFSMKPPTHISEAPTPGIILCDKKVSSKFVFMITNPDTNQVLIREKDGVLRYATKLEKWYKRQTKPAYLHHK